MILSVLNLFCKQFETVYSSSSFENQTGEMLSKYWGLCFWYFYRFVTLIQFYHLGKSGSWRSNFWHFQQSQFEVEMWENVSSFFRTGSYIDAAQPYHQTFLPSTHVDWVGVYCRSYATGPGTQSEKIRDYSGNCLCVFVFVYLCIYMSDTQEHCFWGSCTKDFSKI